MNTSCGACLVARTVILAIILGGGAGYLVTRWVGTGNLSMLATFFGALLPVMWYVRDKKSR